MFSLIVFNFGSNFINKSAINKSVLIDTFIDFTALMEMFFVSKYLRKFAFICKNLIYLKKIDKFAFNNKNLERDFI